MNSSLAKSAKRPRPRRLVLPICIALSISACAQKTPRPEESTQPESTVSSQPESETTVETAASQQKFEQGIAALALQNFPQARRIFGELVRENPELSGAYANLALIDFKQEKYERAKQLVDKAITLNPRQAQAYHLRAQIELHNGEIQKSRADYEQAIVLDPQYLNAHYNLALLYDIYLQDIALAIEHYTIYLSLLGKEDERTREWINHLKATLENG